MATMYDTAQAEHLDTIPPEPAGVAGYIDGAYQSFSGLRAAFPEAGALAISVLADPSLDQVALAYDLEAGNASLPDVLRATYQRHKAGLPTVIYASISAWPGIRAALANASLPLVPVASWPAAGVYVWDADWTETPHLSDGSIATQWTSGATYDTSETAGAFPALASPLPGPGPVPGPTPVPSPVVIDPTQEVAVSKVLVSIPLDGAGTGWLPAPLVLGGAQVPWDRFCGAMVNSANLAEGQAACPGVVAAAEWQGGVYLQVTGGTPSDTYGVIVFLAP